MPIFLLIGWIIAVIPNPQFLGNLSNEKLELISYAKSQAENYSVNAEKFIRLIYCESRFDKLAKGDYRSETDTYMARGLLQFWKGTFQNYSRTNNYKGNYLNPYDQINLSLIMITNNVDALYHWKTCSKKAGFL